MSNIIRAGWPLATVPPAVAFLAGFSGPALRSMAQSLRVIAGLFYVADGAPTVPEHVDPSAFAWSRLERAHVKRIREMLSERYAPSTAKRHFSALRGVLREAGSLAAVDVKGPKGSTEPAGRALSAEEVRKLLDACPSPPDRYTWHGAQLRALVAVGVYGGLRRFEIVALDVGDVLIGHHHFAHETICRHTPERVSHPSDLGGMLTVRRGKGRKERTIALAPAGAKLIADWIALRGDEPGPLFFGRGHDRIGGSTVSYRLTELAERAGVPHVTPHDLRRTFVTGVLKVSGGDLGAGAVAAGHASVATTQRYDRRAQEAAQAATSALDFEAPK